MSEHSFGSAVDFASIDGISPRTEWTKNSANVEYLRQAGKTACYHFTNALILDYNATHHDHFNLDNGYQRSDFTFSQFGNFNSKLFKRNS